MHIHIEALTFDTIIGLLDFERERAQRVIVDLEASYDYSRKDFVDYAVIAVLTENTLRTNKYTLLEDALLGLKKEIYTTYPQLNTLKLKISKPDILPHCSVALSKAWTF